MFVEAEMVNPPAAKDRDDPSYGVVAAPSDGTNLFDAVVYDSHVERTFAAQLENDREHVKLLTKLPRRFRVRTPVGEYSPDWAIVFDENGVQRLYLVRETKSTLNLDDLEWDEAMRIRSLEITSMPLPRVMFTTSPRRTRTESASRQL